MAVAKNRRKDMRPADVDMMYDESDAPARGWAKILRKNCLPAMSARKMID